MIHQARHNIATRYVAAGKPDTAAKVLAGEDAYWLVRHEELKLEREAAQGRGDGSDG